LLLPFATTCSGYAVLTHEAIIDSAWDDSIRPLLMQKFPNTSPQDLLDARRFAYGGSLFQDIGYYPFGSKFFSNLIHYVRTGDYVEALLRESQNANEYAFALGALSHYLSDIDGHRLSTNIAVPILYPKLRRKFGNVVTYEEKPSAHLKVEFGFDVVQVARGNYLPESFHDFIGFDVSKELLERVIPEVYGLKFDEVFGNFGMAMGTFRFSISELIPKTTKVAWQLKKKEIMQLSPQMTKTKFLYVMPRNEYEKQWGKEYKKPGLCSKILAFIIRIIPKIGPLSVLSFKAPTPEIEKMFLKSYATTVEQYRSLINDEKRKQLVLEDKNLDTGQITTRGEYELADETYAKLVDKLSEKQFAGVMPELRQNILNYFNKSQAQLKIKQDRDDKEKLQQQLDTLQSLNAALHSSACF
ncbi:MAG TPA: zinc dependent phospholipase C family protein, partial [Acidobacteriota bacterium]